MVGPANALKRPRYLSASSFRFCFLFPGREGGLLLTIAAWVPLDDSILELPVGLDGCCLFFSVCHLIVWNSLLEPCLEEVVQVVLPLAMQHVEGLGFCFSSGYVLEANFLQVFQVL